jgi:hypothetical protein
MTRAIEERISISNQRGFWLRCFLSGVLAAGTANAQITVQKPLHIRHVQGYITDEKGNAIGRVKVDLLRGGKPVLTATADETGWFHIEGASGKYRLEVSTHSSEMGRDLAVGTDPFTLFCHETLYVMARVNQFCNDCSLRVYTSRKKFFDEVWRNTGHYY